MVTKRAALQSIRSPVSGRRDHARFFVDNGLMTKRAALQPTQAPVFSRRDCSSLLVTARRESVSRSDLYSRWSPKFRDEGVILRRQSGNDEPYRAAIYTSVGHREM